MNPVLAMAATKVMDADRAKAVASKNRERWRRAAAKIGGRGEAELTEKLERNEVLKTLSLVNDQVDPWCAVAIAQVLWDDVVLTEPPRSRRTSLPGRG